MSRPWPYLIGNPPSGGLANIIGISPVAGSTSGGNHVVIHVNDSTGITAASLDGVALSGFAIDDATHVSGNTASHAIGSVNVTVTNGSGLSAPLVNGFIYETITAASFFRPRSLTFDGTFLWTSSVQSSSPESHIIQKIDPRLSSPAVVGVVDMSAYSRGGEGIDGLNPAPVSVAIRQVRAHSGHIFACVQSGLNNNTGQAYGFCVIIDAVTNAIVGHVRFLGATNRSSDASAVTFDGSGNFFVAMNNINVTGTSTINKFNIASVVAAYPSFGSSTSSATVSSGNHIEDMAYGAGFVWAVHSSIGGSSFSMVTQIDPATLSGVDYTLSGSALNYIPMSVEFAFGSVWVAAAGPDNTTVRPLRFDPNTFPSAPTILPGASVSSTGSQGMTIKSDTSYIWMGTYNSHSLYRYSTGLGTEALVSTIVSPDTTDHFADLVHDGVNMWTPTRDGDAPGLVRISTGVGTEAFTYELLNGGP